MRNIIYYFFHVVGFVVSIFYTLHYAKKYKVDGRKSVYTFVISYICSYALMLLLYKLIVGHFGGQNVVRIFVFIPIFATVFSKVFGLNVRKIFDLTAPIVCICQAFGKIGCQIVGCCYSWLPVEWGIMNPTLNTKLFPIQLLEGAVSAAIVVGLVRYSAKHEYDCDGLCMPYMFISFGVTRFFLEFLRNNVKLFWGISELALWGVLMTVVGVVWLWVYRWNHWDPRVTAGAKRTNP